MANKELIGIPKACQYINLRAPKYEQVLNENPEWLKDQGSIPLWSPLNPLSFTGQPKDTIKCAENSFVADIPGRLLSLFGSAREQTDCVRKMENLNNFHLMSNVFALCAALKNDFSKWSTKLMDKITTAATDQYRNFLKEQSLADENVNINHFNGLFDFNGDKYKVQVHQVATGILYLPYGLNQLNLARALNWFFSHYQFGCIKCAHRILAIGKILNNEHGFFMYDCQSCGYPMFAEQQSNSYILRTSYLQVLNYCILKTLNFTTKVNFVMYNVDTTIINSSEIRVLKTKVSQGMASDSAKDLAIRTIANSSGTKVQKNVQKKAPKMSQKSVRNISTGHKPNVRTSLENSVSNTFSSQEKNRKIILDPNKMYYIVAVPKTGLVTAKLESKHLILPSRSVSFDRTNANDQENKIIKESDVEKLLEAINVEKSASTETLTPQTVKEKVIKNPENLGLKVYLVEDNSSRDLTKPKQASTITIAHQLQDFFVK